MPTQSWRSFKRCRSWYPAWAAVSRAAPPTMVTLPRDVTAFIGPDAELGLPATARDCGRVLAVAPHWVVPVGAAGQPPAAV